MSLQDMRPGQPLAIEAATWNRMVAATRQVERGKTGGGPIGHVPLEPSRVRVRNTSGEDRDRGEILGIDAPAIGPADNLTQFSREIILDGVTPAADVHTGRFVVLIEPIRAGQIGQAIISGVVPVRVKLEDRGPEVVHLDRFADVLDGDCTRLRSGAHGSAQILWMEDPDEAEGDDDTYWAIVRLGNSQPIIRKAEVYLGDLVQGSTSPVVGRLLEYVEGSGWWTNEELIDIYAGPSFRGVAFGRNATDPNDADLGDRIDVYYSPEAHQWIAITGGHWAAQGQTEDELTAGAPGNVKLILPPPEGAQGPDAVPREVTIEAVSLHWSVGPHQDVTVLWDTVNLRWEVLPLRPWGPGCSLKMVFRQIDPESSNKTNILDVNLVEIAGAGLTVEEWEDGECDKLAIDVSESCGLGTDEDGKLVIVPEDLAGPGLQESGECGLAVDPGCGLGFDEQDRLAVDVEELAGTGLDASTCSLNVNAGCGLSFNEFGQLVVEPNDLAGTALRMDGDEGECKLGVIYGCGLEIGEFDELKVDAAQLVGRGLEREGEELGLCKLAVKPGCGIKLNDEDDAVEVDAEAIAGSGLVQEEGCAIGVDATPDDDLDESLTVVTGATLSLDGCHVTLNQTTRTLTFKHNADGFIIGVELGEPQQSTSTVDVSTCCCAEPTLYELQKCGEAETSIIVAGADLTDPELGSVHRDDNGDCWEVVAVDAEGEPTAFAETANWPPGGDPCGDCTGPPPATLYHLRLCDDVNTQVVVSGDDLTTPEIGAVYKDANGDCWIVFDEDVAGPADAFTEDEYYPPEGDPCETCDGPTEVFHALAPCGGGSSITVSEADLDNNVALGAVYRRDDGSCWIVVDINVAGPGVPFVMTGYWPPGGDPCGDCQGPPEEDFCCGTRSAAPENGLYGNEYVSTA